MRNNKDSILAATFAKKINKQRFNEYCDFYQLDEEEAKTQLKERGYIIGAI